MADSTFTVRVDTTELRETIDELSDRIDLIQKIQHDNYAWTHPLTWRDCLEGWGRLYRELPRNEKIRMGIVWLSVGVVGQLLFDLLKWMVR